MTSITTQAHPRTTKPTRPRRNIRAVVVQYLAEPQYSVLIPMEILALVWVVSAVIVLLMSIKAGLPLPASVQQSNSRYNLGVIYSFPWFLVSAGALCVNRQFSAALAFGSTRRDFWFGTTIGFLITSATTAAFGTVALLFEKITNHWWFGVHAFDVAALGSGNYLMTFAVIFTLALVTLLIGATYGTVFRSFGASVLIVSILATVIVLIAFGALFIWQMTPVMTFLTPWINWVPSAGFALASLIMVVAGYFVNQHATV